ncbi:MAG: BON domain-containing protein [Alphaproteobacteria bacterium]|nr:BON domain-containing protein [Alphaproteobacteria bacterium]
MNQDERIRNDIQEEIAWGPRVKSTDIRVTCKDGAVRLTGSVASYSEQLASENAAKRVKGVHAIAEDIVFKLPSDNVETDESIAEQISNFMKWNTMVPVPDGQAEVRNGFVTLTGEVDWNFERETIKNQITHLSGVRGIDNSINLQSCLQSRVSEKDVSKSITRALHCNADLERSKIDVFVDGGKVVIIGKVKAFYEKKVIEDAVWAAPSVMQVVDRLRVN